MTQPQPNERASGLRIALDIVRDNRDNAQRMKEIDPGKWVTGGMYQLNKLIEILSNQLLAAGGFLGDAPDRNRIQVDRHYGRQGQPSRQPPSNGRRTPAKGFPPAGARRPNGTSRRSSGMIPACTVCPADGMG